MFKLNPAPTFSSTVTLKRLDGEPGELKLIYRHRRKSEWLEFARGAAGRPDKEVVAELVVGWEGVDAEFSQENLAALLENFHDAAEVIAEDYKTALTESRRGN